MKIKLGTLMLFMSSLFYSHAQTEDFVCAYNENDAINFNQNEIFSNSTDPDFLYAMEPNVMNVYFWQVNDRNGQFGDDPNESITETDVLAAIANLNIFYNQYNFFFKYKGLGQFNSPEVVYKKERDEFGYCHYSEDDNGNYIEDETGFNRIENDCELGQLSIFALNNGYMPKGYINIYIPFTSFASAGILDNPRIILAKPSLTTMGIVHEMGHVFALNHTHHKYRDITDPLNPNYENCEHVTRYPLDTLYNADTNGDEITDTAAALDFKNEHYYELLEQGLPTDNFERFKYINGCTYNGDGKDCLGEYFAILDSDVKNVMAYSGLCKETLTIGQAIRMHEIVIYFASVNNVNYEAKRAQLSDLFRPYKGEYYIVGPLPEGYQEPLFQPGFEYRFLECDGDYTTPAVYGEMFYYDINNVLLSINENDTHYENIKHPNHSAIRIKHEFGDFLDKPEKCYNNFNKAPSGGSITKFNDNVFNTNVTITPQDSTGINNDNLIDNLAPGLYKIEKNYEDGSTQETVIFKENN